MGTAVVVVVLQWTTIEVSKFCRVTCRVQYWMLQPWQHRIHRRMRKLCECLFQPAKNTPLSHFSWTNRRSLVHGSIGIGAHVVHSSI